MTRLEKDIKAEMGDTAGVTPAQIKGAARAALKYIKKAYEAGVQNGTEIPREQWLREQKLEE